MAKKKVNKATSAKTKTNNKSPKNKTGNREVFAFIATFFTIIGFLIAVILWRKDKYVMFYAKQGLVLFIAQVILVILTPFLFFLSPILWICWVILWILSWVNALSGKTKDTFVIGELSKKFNI